jgi:ATP-dependent helicase HrpA
MSPWQRTSITRWDFGRLPASVDIRHGGVVLTRYPALIDAGESASLQLVESASEAQRLTRLGALRLFALTERRELKTQVQHLPQIEKIRLFAAPLAKQRLIDEQLIDLLASRAFYQQDHVPRDAEEFEAQRMVGRKHIVPSVQEVNQVVAPLFAAYHELRLALAQRAPPAWQYAVDDLFDQLATLCAPGFLTATPWNWLQHYPRYLQAARQRLVKLASGGQPRDRQNDELLAPRWRMWRERAEEHQRRGASDANLIQYRWMLEEFRVSLFAQELGVSIPVSAQRLDKQWERVAS